MVESTFESLSRGRPVAEKTCSHCRVSLPFVGLQNPGRKDTGTEVICRACGTRNRYHGFHSPLGRYDPTLRTVDGAVGIFLPVKGASLLEAVRPAKEQELVAELDLGAVTLSTPVMALDAEL